MNIEKYESILREINTDIDRFNAMLAAEFRIAHLDPANTDSYSVIANVPWDDQKWPCGDCPGVYLLCAYQETEPTRLGAYIGKASMSNIGNRLWAHLNPHRATDIYRMNDLSGESFIIEVIVAIALRNPQMRAFASALEEFIIAGVQDRIHLLNGTGIAR